MNDQNKADLDHARQFVEMLTGKKDGRVCFQMKAERPGSQLKASWFFDTLEEASVRLKTSNEQGGAIYVQVNESDGRGRSALNITRVRAFFVDLDASPLEPVTAAGLRPHCIIETSPGRHQVFWIVNDCPIDQFRSVQLALARRFGADSSVTDASRCARLPGFFHQKKERFLARLVESRPDLPAYTLDEIVTGLGLNLTPPQRTPQRLAHRAEPNFPGAAQGARNDSLHKYLCTERAWGADDGEIATLATEANQKNVPPLPQAEVNAIIGSVCKHERGTPTLPRAQAHVAKLRGLPQPERRKALFADDSLRCLAVIKEDDVALYQEIKQESKGLIRDLEHEIKKSRFKLVKSGTAPVPTSPKNIGAALRALGIEPPLDCADLTLPQRLIENGTGNEYLFDEHGTARWSHGERGSTRSDVAPAPVLIVGRSEDIRTGDVSLDIAFHDGARWRSQTEPRAVCADSHRAVALARTGFPITSNTGRDVVAYLSAFEECNATKLPTKRTSNQMGWVGTGHQGFLLGTRVVGEGDVSFSGADVGDTDAAAGFRAEGDPERWSDAIRRALAYPSVAAMFYASLTAPVLDILGLPSFVFDVSNPTSTGKTVGLRVAMSSFGNPAALIRSWNATKVSVERLCALHSGLPIALDDSQTAGDLGRTQGRGAPDFASVIHMVVQGRGKGRGSIRGSQHSPSWATVVLSTGEAPLSRYAPKGGAQSRVLSIEGPPFSTVDEASREFVLTLNETVCAHYGHLGPRWIEYIITNHDQHSAWRNRYRGLSSRYGTAGGAIGRQGEIVAAIVLSGELLHEGGLISGKFGNPFDELWPDIEQRFRTDDAPRAAHELVTSWAAANEAGFWGRGNPDKPPASGWVGVWKTGESECPAIRPDVLDRLLRDNGFDPHAIRGAWRSRNWIVADGDRSRTTKQVRLGESKIRMIQLQSIPEVDSNQGCDGPDKIPQPNHLNEAYANQFGCLNCGKRYYDGQVMFCIKMGGFEPVERIRACPGRELRE